jgi:hypothetical protein
MKVLVACEESQEVCKAFRAKGHEAYSCDIQEPSGGHLEWHILGDALEAIKGGTVVTMDGASHNVGKWDLLIAHPPCTYLSAAGAVCLFNSDHSVKDSQREKKGWEARSFFMAIMNCGIERIAVENPVPLNYYKLPMYSQIIEPFMFGHPWRKRTCPLVCTWGSMQQTAAASVAFLPGSPRHWPDQRICSATGGFRELLFSRVLLKSRQDGLPWKYAVLHPPVEYIVAGIPKPHFPRQGL